MSASGSRGHWLKPSEMRTPMAKEINRKLICRKNIIYVFKQ
jgi:hypothetical protein